MCSSRWIASPGWCDRRSDVAGAAVVAGLIALLAASCASPKLDRQTSGNNAGDKRVFVVYDKWHAAIVVSTADIAVRAIPETAHFPGAQYIEFSWGDAEFFPAPKAGVGLALKAAFWSRGSVLHLVGFDGMVRDKYPGAEILAIGLDEAEFRRLIGFISAEFKREQPAGSATPSAGLFAQSRFFPANSKFSVLRTCNAWVAEAFVAAGLPLRAELVFTAGDLAGRLRPFAIQTEPAKTVGQAPRVLVRQGRTQL
jgi:uncharacterized protein (TIGR02117 family)